MGNDYEVIEAAQSWAEIAFTINALMLMFVQLKLTRPDNGFRQSGLVPFALVSAVLTGLIQLVALLVWPFLIGPDLVPGTVLAEVGSDPWALLTAAGLSLCAYSVFPAVCIPMMAGGWRGALVCLVPFLGIVLGGGYLATVVLHGYPSPASAVAWAGAAAVGLVLLTISAVIVHWLRRADPHVHGTPTPGGGVPGRPTPEEIGGTRGERPRS
ncbi:MAG TPA: hypothetical protein VK065_05440 [Brevibacterium sp.]|nr:hypothetical protein [Brevibacterium sp.]